MQKQIDIPKQIVEQVNAHLILHLPEEGCGFLLGKNGRVAEFHPAENELHSRVAFRMAPADQIRIMLDAEDRDLDIIAAVHSHPHGPVRPSLTDLAEAHWREFDTVIVSLQQPDAPEWRGWHLTKEIYEEVDLFVSPSVTNFAK